MGTEKDVFDALQLECGTWADKTFPTNTQQSIINHLKKEVTQELHPDCEPDELADCILLLIHLAHKRGLSLYDEVRKKFEINKARKWGKPNEQGFVEHIREE